MGADSWIWTKTVSYFYSNQTKQYPAKVAAHIGNILVIDINYNKDSKLQTCKIKEMAK